MQNAYVVTGTLTDAKTVALDESVPFPAAKVRVIIERLEKGSPQSYVEVMAQIRARQKARQHQPPSQDDVDSYLQAERESWEE